MSQAPGETTGPAPFRAPTPPAPGRYLTIQSRRGDRSSPSPGGMARRRWFVTLTKLLLPAGATLLLALIAVWPEFDRATDRARIAMHGLSATVEGARLSKAHYNGVDERGRPYTVTAETAAQRDADLVEFTRPNADMTLENGGWLNVTSARGVFARKAGQLDLSGDVVLYRDDGTVMTTASATMLVRAGTASGAEPVHVEGPFGTIDATGFTTVDKGAAIQFWGPATVELNGAGP